MLGRGGLSPKFYWICWRLFIVACMLIIPRWGRSSLSTSWVAQTFHWSSLSSFSHFYSASSCVNNPFFTVFFGATRRTLKTKVRGQNMSGRPRSLASKAGFFGAHNPHPHWGGRAFVAVIKIESEWREASKRSFQRCFSGGTWSMGTSSRGWSKVCSN